MSLTESTVEEAALQWFGELGFAAKHGPHIAPGELHQERTGFGKTICQHNSEVDGVKY